MQSVKFNVGENAVIQLGEDLYKNIYGVLIEYITNSYDADASKVDIKINRDNRTIIIKDDGIGMSHDDLKTSFLNVGLNCRKENKRNITDKGRYVTGRKGFGKLACFGLFDDFKVVTIKEQLKSELIIHTWEDENGDFHYDANISDEPESTTEEDGTTIFLLNNSQTIPGNQSIATSIAKRINLMYDGNEDDKDGFYIQLEDIKIDKTFRDELVLNHDIKFKYEIPKDLKRFTTEKSIIQYIEENNIQGVVIAREKTVRIKENKGVVLFARGKLCQEATYLNINPSNNYGYAHLYAEFDVSFIDNEGKDNIGTDRTALKATEITDELFTVIEKLMKSYARLYDEDEKKRKEQAVEEFKEDDKYKNINQSISKIEDSKLKEEVYKLLQMRIKDSITSTKIDEANFDGFAMVTNSIISTYSVKSEQISKDEPKDNVMTSYDYLMEYLRNKYNYTGTDGAPIINHLYGQNSTNVKFTTLANCLTGSVADDLKKAMRELGSSIVNIRNSLQHTNNRTCINDNISIENSKRFLIMIDLFIELDTKFFEA